MMDNCRQHVQDKNKKHQGKQAMSPPSARAAIYGVSIAVLGLMISLTPFGTSLEENFGLHILFRMRGERTAPEEVMIITMDKDSAERLNLSGTPRKWPRSVHARLLEILSEKNPAVISFDLIFAESRQAEEDDAFEEAIRNAGNVVIAEWFQTEKVPVYKDIGANAGIVFVEKRVLPLDRFQDCALASAPFALPKMPVKLNSYCAFMTSAQDAPSLPVMVFQVYALNVYDEMTELLKQFTPSIIPEIPLNRDAVTAEKNIEKLVCKLRNHFQQNSFAADQMLYDLDRQKMISDRSGNIHILKSLIQNYQDPEHRYLNFYGPPGTILTFPYYKVLESEKNPEILPFNFDFKDKAVFIGYSEHSRLERKDGFYTVFSQADGQDISGVEILATAFSNILEDMHIRPLPPVLHLMFVGLWGMLIGIVCMAMPASAAAVCAAGFSVFYIWGIYYQFGQNALWFPLIVPVFFQVPVAFFGSVLWKYFDANKERKNIRIAFGYHLPDDVVDRLAKNLKNIESSTRLVHGTCLFTDAEQFTALSEKMEPTALNVFMNKYFEVLFEPVRRHSGIVTDIKGDSILAIWAAAYPESKSGNLACKAALEIIRGVDRFNRLSDPLVLPTRIGVHSGLISLGHIGAIDHFEYRAAGDIVNTAARMEGLNKYLGTKVLVSAAVLDQLEGFLCRNLGIFLLAGKSNPVEVFELICKQEDAQLCHLDLCNMFSNGFDAFRNRCWKTAINFFNQATHLENGKGPSFFYLELCKKYLENPPDTNWNGAVCVNSK